MRSGVRTGIGEARLGEGVKTEGWDLNRSTKPPPPQERARRYREMADAAFLKAQHLKTAGQRAEYLSLAAAWHALAQEMEADIRKLAQLEASQERLREAGLGGTDQDLR